MRISLLILILCLGISCKNEKTNIPEVQNIVDEAIAVSGGDKYNAEQVYFKFRDRNYIRELRKGRKILKRITHTNDTLFEDILSSTGFKRMVNGLEKTLPDTTALSMANSVNSVHYFAFLPYGLNDPAVHKKLLGLVDIKGQKYFEVEVTFSEDGGGEDFEDVYVYWFNEDTKKPDYLAYSYQTDEGGYRFREAFNERYIGGLRFVDYRNYKPKLEGVRVSDLDSLYIRGELELLSVIALDSIRVISGNYN